MGSASGDQIRILHAEDDPGFAELTETYLEREDERISLETAPTATEALELLDDEPFDCVVSDYDMPGMKGVEFLKAVREDYPDLPFILFTGKGSEEVASDAITAGVSDYLQKQPGAERFEILANRILNHVERTRAKRDLDKSESHLKHAQTMAKLGSWQLDLETDSLTWSEEVCNIFGVSCTGSLTYERFKAYVHQEDRDRVDREWRAALRGEPYDIEHRIVTEGGETRWVRERADVEFDEDGTPVSALGVVQDITDRKERVQEQRVFREAVEAAGHCIYWTDSDGVLQYVNPAFEETTGYSPEEAIGRTPRILKSGVHDESFYEALWETIISGETWRAEVTNSTKSNEQYVVDQTIAPVEGESGDIEYFVAVNAEITERKRQERELQQHREKLKHRTEELEELTAQLESQRDDLDLLNQMLQHDMRNELQIIMAYAELIEEECDGEPVHDHVQTLLETVANAVELTKTVREMADVMRSTEVDLHPVDPQALLQRGLEDIRSAHPNATIVREASLADVSVQANGMLESVFRNLVKNAIQHNDNDSPEVVVSATERPDSVVVRFADNGPGVPDDRKAEIFDRGENDEQSQGAGIGLYLVRTLVERYEGDVWVEDTDPEGAVFVVELPKAP